MYVKNQWITIPTLHVFGHNLLFGDKKVKLTPQQYELIQKFISAKEWRVGKAKIKKMWVKKNDGDTETNMTTLVNRMNNLFVEAEIPYRIISDSADRDYYCLELKSGSC